MYPETLIYKYSKNSLALKILFLIQFNILLKACNFEMRRLLESIRGRPLKWNQLKTSVLISQEKKSAYLLEFPGH